MADEFRQIPGWPGYRIDNKGTLQSCRDCAGLITETWHEKTPVIDADGYCRTKLHNESRTLYVGIHFLVLTAFGSQRPPGKSMPLHADGNPENNHISNLRWGFAVDNARDRDRHHRTARGEKGGMAKLTWQQVDSIRNEYAGGGVSLQQIASQYGVSKKTILNVVHKRTWVRGRADMNTDAPGSIARPATEGISSC